jgi:hypothetical protein
MTAESIIIALGFESEVPPLIDASTSELERCLVILAQPGGTDREEQLSRYAEREIQKEIDRRSGA